MEWSEITSACGRTGAIDLLSVAGGDANGCRLDVPPDAVSRVNSAASFLGLTSAMGWDRVRAHGGERRAIYVARDVRTVQRLRRSDEGGLRQRYSEDVGVPACCAVGVEEATVAEMLLRRYDDEHLIHWVMNVSLMEFDCALVSWVPCRATCEASIRAAYRRFERLREAEAQLALQLATILCTTTLTARHLGTVVFHAKVDVDTTVVSEVLLTSGCLSEVARAGSRLSRRDGGVVSDQVFLSAEWCRLYRHV